MIDLAEIILVAGKIMAMVGTLLYLVFASVIVKQVRTMSADVVDKFNGILMIISYIHWIFALVLFVLSIVIL